MAVLTALLATALVMALGLSIVLIGSGEAALSGHDRAARALRLAAEGAVHLAVADLQAMPSWATLLAEGTTPPLSAAPGRLADGNLAPTPPWGGAPLDLRALTSELQAATLAGGAGDPQAWRLLEYGPLDRVVPGGSAGPWYVAVWVADDPADNDGDPSMDANGLVRLRGAAYGPGNALASTEVSLSRVAVPGGPDRIRILTIRPGV